MMVEMDVAIVCLGILIGRREFVGVYMSVCVCGHVCVHACYEVWEVSHTWCSILTDSLNLHMTRGGAV